MKKLVLLLLTLFAGTASAQFGPATTTMYPPLFGYFSYTPVVVNGNLYNPKGGYSATALNTDVAGLLADGWTSTNPLLPNTGTATASSLNCGANFSFTAAPSAGNTCQYAAFSISGIQAYGTSFSPDYFNITDTQDTTGSVGTGTQNSVIYGLYTMQAGFSGLRNEIYYTMNIQGSPDQTDASSQAYVTAQINSRGSANTGGTDLNYGDAAGSFWGMDIGNGMSAGATNIAAVTGFEIDNNTQVGTSILSNMGFASYAANNRGIRGTAFDASFVSASSNVISPLTTWADVFAIGRPNAYFPTGPDGVFFQAIPRMYTSYQQPTALKGHDYRAVLFGAGSFESNNAGIDQAGDISGANLYSAGGVYTANASVTSLTVGTATVGETSGIAATVTGYISGTTLTVTSVASGILNNGNTIVSQVAGAPAITANTVITGFGANTYGGVGTYTVNNSQTAGSSGSPISIGAEVTGGAFFNQGSTPSCNIAAPPNGGTNAACSVASYGLTKAIAPLVNANFQASISGASGNTATLTAIAPFTGSPLQVGDVLKTGIESSLTTITAFVTGSGGAGTYTITCASACANVVQEMMGIVYPGVDVGCQTGDILTAVGGTGTAGSIIVTVASTGYMAGHVVSAAIYSPGNYTAKSATMTTTGGHCTTQPNWTDGNGNNTIGFGITGLTVSNVGSGYPLYPLPYVWFANYSSARNLMPMVTPVMTTVIKPYIGDGYVTAATPSASCSVATDQSATIQADLNFATALNKALVFPAGYYGFANTVGAPSGSSKLQSEFPRTVSLCALQQSTGNALFFSLTPAVNSVNITGFNIDGLTLDAGMATAGSPPNNPGSGTDANIATFTGSVTGGTTLSITNIASGTIYANHTIFDNGGGISGLGSPSTITVSNGGSTLPLNSSSGCSGGSPCTLTLSSAPQGTVTAETLYTTNRIPMFTFGGLTGYTSLAAAGNFPGKTFLSFGCDKFNISNSIIQNGAYIFGNIIGCTNSGFSNNLFNNTGAGGNNFAQTANLPFMSWNAAATQFSPAVTVNPGDLTIRVTPTATLCGLYFGWQQQATVNNYLTIAQTSPASNQFIPNGTVVSNVTLNQTGTPASCTVSGNSIVAVAGSANSGIGNMTLTLTQAALGTIATTDKIKVYDVPSTGNSHRRNIHKNFGSNTILVDGQWGFEATDNWWYGNYALGNVTGSGGGNSSILQQGGHPPGDFYNIVSHNHAYQITGNGLDENCPNGGVVNANTVIDSGRAGISITSNGTASSENPLCTVDGLTVSANTVLNANFSTNSAFQTGTASVNASGATALKTVTGAGTNGTYTNVALTATSGGGSGGLATVIVAGGVVTSATMTTAGSGYAVNDTQSFTVTGGSGTAAIQTLGQIGTVGTPITGLVVNTVVGTCVAGSYVYAAGFSGYPWPAGISGAAGIFGSSWANGSVTLSTGLVGMITNGTVVTCNNRNPSVGGSLDATLVLGVQPNNATSTIQNTTISSNTFGDNQFASLPTATLTTTGGSAGQNVLTFASTTGVVVGQQVYCSGTQPFTQVASFIANTSVTLTTPTAAAVANGASCYFYNPTPTTVYNVDMPSGVTLRNVTFSPNNTLYGASAGQFSANAIAQGLSLVTSIANGGNGTATPAITAGSGISIAGSWPNYTVSSNVATPVQTGLPVSMSASAYIDSSGNMVIGQNPASSATVSFSATSGSVTATYSAGTPLTGTSAGDVNRYLIVLDSGTYKTCLITAFSSSTVATCTLSATLTTTGPFANGSNWISGTNATTNTASAGAVTYSAPLSNTYASGFYYIPAASPIGTAGMYYGTATSPVTVKLFNNVYASGTPTIPTSTTAFSGLTAGTFTQTTATIIPLIIGNIGAGQLGVNGCIDFDMAFSYNNSAGTKTTSTKLLSNAGTQIAATTFGYGTITSKVCNAGSASAQSYSGRYTQPTAGTITTTPVNRSTVNTAVATTANISENLQTATDTVTIEYGSIIVRPN